MMKLSDVEWDGRLTYPGRRVSQPLVHPGFRPQCCRIVQDPSSGLYYVVTDRVKPVGVKWSRSPKRRPPTNMDDLDLLAFLVDCEPYAASVSPV